MVNQDFKPRYCQVQDIQFPQSHHRRIVILPNDEAMGFRYDCYDSRYLSGKVSKENFNETLRQATTICGKMWCYDQRIQAKDPFDYYKKLMLYIIPLTCLSFFLYILRIYVGSYSDNQYLIYFATVFQVLVVIIAVIIFIKTYFAKFTKVNLEDDIMQALIQFFNSENEKDMYRGKRLKWNVADRFFWVELHIN